MSTTCTACNGTGMLPGSNDLDCASCETATKRVMLETWAKEQGMRIDPDQLWAVFRKGQECGIEQAAKICESVNNYDNPMTAGDCADAIRALKP